MDPSLANNFEISTHNADKFQAVSLVLSCQVNFQKKTRMAGKQRDAVKHFLRVFWLHTILFTPFVFDNSVFNLISTILKIGNKIFVDNFTENFNL